uniref:Secreted protein n=1 Tax=Heterorhabditis bacteriophora TaxID=37862 RepID=A0A1I7WD88_HETBA
MCVTNTRLFVVYLIVFNTTNNTFHSICSICTVRTWPELMHQSGINNIKQGDHTAITMLLRSSNIVSSIYFILIASYQSFVAHSRCAILQC